jgi:drug/metabolite transporter (DMT)-like permease
VVTARVLIQTPVANLSSPLLSLSAALAWGAGDFSGGMATRRTAVFGVIAIAHAVGLVFMLALAVLFGEPLPNTAALTWAALAGIVGGAGLACLYQALAVGKMGLNAPLSSVIAALVPLAFSFFSEGLPHALRMAGFALALISIWLIAMPSDTDGSPEGLGLAIAAGIGLGGFLLLIKFAGSTAVFWPLAMARAGSFGLMFAIILMSRREWRPAPESLHWVLLAGLLDSGANALYVAALHKGSLAVAAVLSSLYPASTVILARLLLKERWSRLQGFGMTAALIAVAMISL